MDSKSPPGVGWPTLPTFSALKSALFLSGSKNRQVWLSSFGCGHCWLLSHGTPFREIYSCRKELCVSKKKRKFGKRQHAMSRSEDVDGMHV
jgi:hypothetical protein